ncbi:cation-translocating P-type ATPase [Pseudogulbenkiania sp. MAI-1]|uniref:cation-translocating P-type ATPase n=1 Tax=Pseudogulbenkiania sp. MAI-1 TaxID=990370 RepID=UPI00045EA322|nr:cation-translocating P-type ATPase [Pseudogulbenkiania sp. MAI-1]
MPADFSRAVPNHLPDGLSDAEAAALLARVGPNILFAEPRRTLWRLTREILREPMFLLLLVAGSIYLLLGDVREALLLLGFVLVVVMMTVLQERRTERVLETLRELASPRAVVRRAGEQKIVVATELVPGDIVLIGEGDRVPADGMLLVANELSLDESQLSGESVPVRKLAGLAGAARVGDPGGDDTPFAYAGSLVVQGQGVMRVCATGKETELGKIGRMLGGIEQPASPLQLETRHAVRRLAVYGLVLCLGVLVLYGLTRGNWLNGLLAGITLAMGILPQEFPVILTVFMALGARRIAQVGVLTRRLNAIETLGQTSVLCVDKTGTLTHNRMAVRRLYVDGRLQVIDDTLTTLDEPYHELLEYLILASEIDPIDPMERAFHRLGNSCLAGTEHLRPDWALTQEYELTPQLQAMSHGWTAPDRDYYPVASKGAPEAVFDLCHLSEAQCAQLMHEVEALAEQGLRVLAVAKARHDGAEWPSHQHDFEFEFLGLVGLADPVRAEVPDAIAQCRQAGVRLVMITGDYPVTARAVARQAGIDDGMVVSGEMLEQLDDAALCSVVREACVFARVRPHQKLRLVEALKANGEVVAMTGDGVNDAPALRAAHIGIAMGRRGTQIAREAAALVLLDDNFTAIVDAMRQGRRSYDNLVKAVTYVIAVHLPMIGLTIVPLLVGWPLLLAPAHVVFLELVIDPVGSIVFENETAHPGLMRRPPRPAGEPLFSRRLLARSLWQGSVLLAGVLVLYTGAVLLGAGADEARSMAFLTLVMGNLALVFRNRDPGAHRRERNHALWWVIGITLGMLLLVTQLKPLAALFRFGPVTAWQYLYCFFAAAGIYLLAGLLRNGRRGVVVDAEQGGG